MCSDSKRETAQSLVRTASLCVLIVGAAAGCEADAQPGVDGSWTGTLEATIELEGRLSYNADIHPVLPYGFGGPVGCDLHLWWTAADDGLPTWQLELQAVVRAEAPPGVYLLPRDADWVALSAEIEQGPGDVGGSTWTQAEAIGTVEIVSAQYDPLMDVALAVDVTWVASEDAAGYEFRLTGWLAQEELQPVFEHSDPLCVPL